MSELETNTGTNNTIRKSAKSQQRSPIGFDEAKQLSQAHRARAMARTREMYIG